MKHNPFIIIPARLASTRLPNKPLADIAGRPMIVHVWQRAVEAGVGDVVVSSADQPIADAITGAGGRTVLTAPDLPSGSDRVFEAARQIDPDGTHDVVINVQGDMPTIDPGAIRAVLEPLDDPGVDIGTLAAEIRDAAELENPNVVKVAVSLAPGARMGRALWFSRRRPADWSGAVYHHIGIYAFRRGALERFVRLPPSPGEISERLEQLRALEAGMRIDVALVDTVPLGVDTEADLDRARALLSKAP
ncbi:MAG: 3-deoxy-manno-octulosonate cytidylyltransferase [Alphaproteobacteria bacterium]